jgi:outer membrane biosynthesis protein TonB
MNPQPQPNPQPNPQPQPNPEPQPNPNPQPNPQPNPNPGPPGAGRTKFDIRVGQLNIDQLRTLSKKENERLPVGKRIPGISRVNQGVLRTFLQAQGYNL